MQGGLIWLAAAVALAVGETLAGELFLLMLAGGAIGGGVAALAGASALVQVLVFALVSLLLLGAVRPLARRRMLASLPEHETGVAALPGRRVTVVEAIGGGTGLVEIGGDTWTARPTLEGETFGVGESVFVDRVDGATVRVLRAP